MKAIEKAILLVTVFGSLSTESKHVAILNELTSSLHGTDMTFDNSEGVDDPNGFVTAFTPRIETSDDEEVVWADDQTSSRDEMTTETYLFDSHHEDEDPTVTTEPTLITDILQGNGTDDEIIKGRAACKCGVSRRLERDFGMEYPFPDDNRIVGGVPASIRDLPWTAALVRSSSSRPFCGGTVINDYYVLTASHCVDKQQPSNIHVVLGQQNFPSSTGTRYRVSSITMHESYDRRTVNNDIALLRLSERIHLGGNIVPACLPATNAHDFAGLSATAAGWGTTSQGGSLSRGLRKVTVPVLSNNDCNNNSKYNGKITANHLCAGELATGGKDSCQGDSGGPLIIDNGGRQTLIGIVSWGYGCAQPQSPGVYTRVGRYPGWILQNTRGADWCQA